MSDYRVDRVRINGKLSETFYILWQERGRSRRRSTRCVTREAAEAWAQRWTAIRTAPKAGGTVTELMEAYRVARIAEGAREDTMGWAIKPLLPHFGALDPLEVSAPYVRGYLVRRRGHGVADPTIGRELRTLRAALYWGEREGWISKAPKFSVPGEAAPRDRYLSREMFEAVTKACPSLHVQTFLHLGVFTGARMGAILDLRWDRVDFDGALIHYPRRGANAIKQLSPKVMPGRLREALTTARQMARTDWVVEWAGERVYSVRNALMRAAEAAGVTDFRVHDLRRTCAVWMLHAGASFSQVAAQLDDNVRTVQKHYAHHAPGYLRDVLERM